MQMTITSGTGYTKTLSATVPVQVSERLRHAEIELKDLGELFSELFATEALLVSRGVVLQDPKGTPITSLADYLVRWLAAVSRQEVPHGPEGA